MRIVVRSVFFCTDVAERARAKGDHNERPFVYVVAGGRMSLGVFEITGSRIYKRQGKCGRENPRGSFRKWTPRKQSAQPTRAKISLPFALPGHTRRPRGEGRMTHLLRILYVFFCLCLDQLQSESSLRSSRVVQRRMCGETIQTVLAKNGVLGEQQITSSLA
jgi:hypothetical protein